MTWPAKSASPLTAIPSCRLPEQRRLAATHGVPGLGVYLAVLDEAPRPWGSSDAWLLTNMFSSGRPLAELHKALRIWVSSDGLLLPTVFQG